MMTGFCSGAPLNPALLDENVSVQDTLDTLTSELEEAGVCKKESRRAAAFFYSAFFQHQSLLLAGPFGEELGQAICGSLFGQTAGVLDCSLPYEPAVLQAAEEDPCRVILIKHIFMQNWLMPLIDYIQSTSKFIVVLHPFWEDLLVEPGSLFSYLFPVMTELFMERAPSRTYIGGTIHNAAVTGGQERKQSDAVKTLFQGAFMQQRVFEWLNILEKLTPEPYEYTAWLYLFFPYACVRGQTGSLAELLEKSSSGRGLQEKLMYYLQK